MITAIVKPLHHHAPVALLHTPASPRSLLILEGGASVAAGVGGGGGGATLVLDAGDVHVLHSIIRKPLIQMQQLQKYSNQRLL